MAAVTGLVVPAVLALTAVYALVRRVNVYDALVRGAGEGLRTAAGILPAMTALLTAVYMLRASGLLELLSRGLGPALAALGVPGELAPLAVVRPISGSAALGLGAELIRHFGPDSRLGRTAAVLLGSTETTFYTVSLYFSAAGVRRTRYAIPAALCADMAALLTAPWAVRLVFGA